MKKLKKVYIEIGNICNLKCDFCPETKRQKEFMDLKTFSTLLDQVKPHTDYIYFHVKGEPLLHPQLDELLDISCDKGLKVNITTNGTLISKVKDKILNKQALRQISFSLHSFDGNYDENQFFEERRAYFQAIFDFIEAAKETPLLISLRLWNLEQDNEINQEKAEIKNCLK